MILRGLARWLRRLFVAAALTLSAILAAQLAFPLPALDGRLPSTAIPAGLDTPLGAALLPLAARNPGLSGILPLRRGPDAFAARVALVRAARASIDAQYYIWQRDAAGLLLLDELRAAAARGVRVRLLLDDNGTSGLDAELAALDAMPDFEVRLFNPFTLRNPRGPAYLFDFVRLNRRMHNKSFTVDGVVTIVGGRNVGNIYFARGTDGHYSDFDVLAAGPAAAATGADFDAYWASASAYPIAALVAPPADGLALFAGVLATVGAMPEAAAFRETAAASSLLADILTGALPLDWARVTLASDDPAKGLGLAATEGLMISRLGEMIGDPQRQVDLIAAYFIPGRRGAELITDLAARGLRLRILTNSLEATDVLAVHSGYVEYRDALLDAGVELYEMKSATVPRETDGHSDVPALATSSLHAKTLTIDGARVFVGSFNFDPRSFFLNCEMGFLIDSPALAAEFSGIFAERVPVNAYRVERAESGGTLWFEPLPEGGERRYTSEPNSPWTRRAAVAVIGWLPIDWLL